MNRYQVNLPKNDAELRAFVARCDAEFEARMDEVVVRIAETPGLKMVGLTGPTCSGKTTTARKLTECLKAHGHRVHVVSIDDFYYDKDVLHERAKADPDIEIDYDSEDTIDVELLREKTESLLSGAPTEMPRFNFQTGYREKGDTIAPEHDDVFLFEGIQVLYPKVASILNRGLYRSIYIAPLSEIEQGGEVFVPNRIRLLRRLVRDFRYRASDPEFTLYLWKSVRANEEKNIFPNKQLCHEFIDSTMPCELGMLKPYLEELLPSVGENNDFYHVAQTLLGTLEQIQTVPASYMAENSLYKEFI